MSGQKEDVKAHFVLVSGVPSGDQPGNMPPPNWRQWRVILDRNIPRIPWGPEEEKIRPHNQQEIIVPHQPRREIVERIPGVRIPA